MTCEKSAWIPIKAMAELSPAERAEFLAHAEDCATCRDRLSEQGYMESLLVGAFRSLESDMRPQKRAILARIGDRRPGSSTLRPAAGFEPAAFGGSRRGRWLFVATNVCAALLLLTAYIGYLSLLKVHRQTVAVGARMEVKNLAITLRLHAARHAGLPESGPQGLLVALSQPHPNGNAIPLSALADRQDSSGFLLDGFGSPFQFRRADASHGLVYSFGPNGLDDSGSDDDVVALISL